MQSSAYINKRKETTTLLLENENKNYPFLMNYLS